jgi:putative ABC transport system permease protein
MKAASQLSAAILFMICFFGINPIGEKILINGITYTIIGTLEATRGFSMGSTNEVIIIPYTTALQSLGIKDISSLDVYLEDTNLADETVVKIKGVLNRAFNYKEDSYTIFNCFYCLHIITR